MVTGRQILSVWVLVVSLGLLIPVILVPKQHFVAVDLLQPVVRDHHAVGVPSQVADDAVVAWLSEPSTGEVAPGDNFLLPYSVSQGASLLVPGTESQATARWRTIQFVERNGSSDILKALCDWIELHRPTSRGRATVCANELNDFWRFGKT